MGEVGLRTWSVDDAEWYVGQVSDPDIQRFTTERDDLTVEEFRDALRRLEEQADQAGFVAVDLGTGERLANIAADRQGATATLSYWVAAEGRGRGAATAALRLMSAWAVAHWEVEELRLWTHVDNVGSQKVAIKAGYEYLPGCDEVKVVRGEERPGRWYRSGGASSRGSGSGGAR